MASSEEIAENVKQARELALMGDYDDAKVYYSGAVQGVQLILKQIQEPDKKQKWREVRVVVTARVTVPSALIQPVCIFLQSCEPEARWGRRVSLHVRVYMYEQHSNIQNYRVPSVSKVSMGLHLYM